MNECSSRQGLLSTITVNNSTVNQQVATRAAEGARAFEEKRLFASKEKKGFIIVL